MLAVLAAAVVGTEIAQDDRRSGLDFAGPETRAMQQDDTAKDLLKTYFTPMANQHIDPEGELPPILAYLKSVEN